MNEQATILVVEDDDSLMLGLEENLKAEGYRVLKAADGKEGLERALEERPDLIILDLMLPEMSGYQVCRTLREQRIAIPIVMLTARTEEFDKLLGFESGADDYVTKPFSIRELLARVKAVLRREEGRAAAPATYAFGEFTVDTGARTLSARGRDIQVTRTEFDLLVYFLTHRGVALPREDIMRDVWNMKYLSSQRSLDSFVASLRAKIEKNPGKPEWILTVHGVGYKFRDGEPAGPKRR